MAEPLSRHENLQWFKQHYGWPEAAWAASFAHLDRTERQELRERLLNPEAEFVKGLGKNAAQDDEFRRRILVALESLDLIDDSPPDKAARKAAAALLARVSRT
jgi:hypothetical protein